MRSIRATGPSDQVNGGGNYDFSATDSLKVSWVRLISDFAVANFLPIALISGMTLGLTNPTLGCVAHRYSLSRFSTFGIFIISGLMLRSEEVGAAVEAWPAGMLGLVSILLLTPFLSRFILKIQLVPQEFITGLAIFCCMPTTLSSGVALTNLVGGNSALALAMTVMSNLLGMILVPISLSNYIGAGAGIDIPTMQLFRSLITTLLVPLILGKVFRDTFDGVAKYVDQNRRFFSMMSSILLSLVPWIQVSKSRPLFLTVTPVSFAIAIGLGIILHLILLAINTLAVKILSPLFGGKESVFAKKENSRAVIIVASQKTLPVMVAVVDQLKGALGEPGLLVLPCVASHINQIIIDSFLVNLWLQKDAMLTKTKEP